MTEAFRTQFRDQWHVVLAAHGNSTDFPGEKWGMEKGRYKPTEPPPISALYIFRYFWFCAVASVTPHSTNGYDYWFRIIGMRL